MGERMKIYKQPIEETAWTNWHGVNGLRITHVGLQNGQPYFWYLLEDADEKLNKPLVYRVFGTGWTIPDDGYEFIGTWIDDPYVWHLVQWVG